MEGQSILHSHFICENALLAHTQLIFFVADYPQPNQFAFNLLTGFPDIYRTHFLRRTVLGPRRGAAAGGEPGFEAREAVTREGRPNRRKLNASAWCIGAASTNGNVGHIEIQRCLLKF